MKSITVSFFTVALLFLELLVVATINFSFCNGSSHVGCVQSERKALLSFKQDLSYDPNSNRLASWVGDGDCCRWAGVVCDNFTGHVLELHLRNPHLEYLITSSISFSLEAYYTSPITRLADMEAYERSMLGGKINPSLLELKHLIYLDLSGNDFGGIQIPRFLGSMDSLRYLNLSNSGFFGIIPHQIGNLSNLQYLDLNNKYDFDDNMVLYVENLFWLSKLSLLEHLDLSGVDLSEASDHWLPMTNTLSSLKVLQLSYCQLHHFSLLSIVNFSSLTKLDISENYYYFSNPLVPSWIFGLSRLVFLDLSEIYVFKGPIPDQLQNLTSLRYLDLSSNGFNSSIPEWLYTFSHLEYLFLADNRLQGTISSTIGNLTSTRRLDLSYNKLEGRIPKSFGRLCNLRSISLSYINLSQEISQILDIFSKCISYKLESLELDGSQISGTIPESFLQVLSSLKGLDISSNRLNGTLSEIHFTNVTRLLYFDASENLLELTVSLDWIPSFQLDFLNLRSCTHLGQRFPSWLLSQKFLVFLDVSNSGILDNVPSTLWNNISQLTYLNLSHNQFHGQFPQPTKMTHLYWLDLSSNNFSGPLPLLPTSVSIINFSNNTFSGSISQFLCHRTSESKETEIPILETEVLRLGYNFLAEELPDCWMLWPSLKVLDLRNNKFTGTIPPSLGTLSMVESLHLHKNHLIGTIFESLKNCTELNMLDVSENELLGSIPTWIGERFSSMKILILRSNKFHGSLPLELCSLASLQILDLADNNLFGAIPRCIKNISAMVTMEFPATKDMEYNDINFTGNFEDALLVTKGETYEYNTILNLVRSVDLSKNKFSGEIPIEVTSLAALQSLNLSHNSFTGKIPANFGVMKSLESVDFSWNQLSGEIPQSISSLNFLSYLNLSNNNLIGEIPMSTQLQGFDPSCFMGNELWGSPLPKNCTSPTPGHNENDRGKDDEEQEVVWFYVSMALGFVVGFWSLIGPLIVNRRWRYMYYRFLDRLGDIIGCIVRKCFYAF